MVTFVLGADFSWDRIHRINTPNGLRNAVREYVNEFPCEECRDHFAELVQTHPFPITTVQTSEDVRVWGWLTHNLVNQRLGKEWYPLSTYLNGTSVT